MIRFVLHRVIRHDLSAKKFFVTAPVPIDDGSNGKSRRKAPSRGVKHLLRPPLPEKTVITVDLTKGTGNGPSIVRSHRIGESPMAYPCWARASIISLNRIVYRIQSLSRSVNNAIRTGNKRVFKQCMKTLSEVSDYVQHTPHWSPRAQCIKRYLKKVILVHQSSKRLMTSLQISFGDVYSYRNTVKINRKWRLAT